MKKYIIFLVALFLIACEGNEPIPAYVDLGLPSGTMWKNVNEKNPKDENGFYTYDEANREFGTSLPNYEQMKELKDMCIWTWKKNGYQIVGLNGNHIFLPAAGIRDKEGVHAVGLYGDYWIWTNLKRVPPPDPKDLRFDSTQVHIHWIDYPASLSVRLVQ